MRLPAAGVAAPRQDVVRSEEPAGGDDQEHDEDALAARAKRVLPKLVQRPRPRAILETMLAAPGLGHKTLAKRVGISDLMLTHYLKDLMRHHVVVLVALAGKPGYDVASPDAVRAALAHPLLPPPPTVPEWFADQPTVTRRRRRSYSRRPGTEMVGRMDAIMRVVETWPGANSRQIGDLVGLHHLRVLPALQRLVRMDRVQVESMGGYDHYFATDHRIGNDERILMCFASKPQPRDVLGALLCTRWMSYLDLSVTTGLSVPSLRHHLRRMTQADQLHARTTAGQREYRLCHPGAAMAALARTERGYSAAVA